MLPLPNAPTYGFCADFYRSMVPATAVARSAAEPGAARQDVLSTRSYAPSPLADIEADQASLTEFCRSPSFLKAREEWQQAIDDILKVAEDNEWQDALQLLKRATTRLGPPRSPVVDVHTGAAQTEAKDYRPDVKLHLESIARHLHDARVPMDTRRLAIEAMAEGFYHCQERLRHELWRAALMLSSWCSELGGEVRRAFDLMAFSQVQAFLRTETELTLNQLSSPHVVDAFGRALGLPFGGVPDTVDPFAHPIPDQTQLAQRCGARLARSLTPATVAHALAQECLADLTQSLEERLNGTPLSLRHDVTHWPLVEQALGKLSARFGSLRMQSVVLMDDDLMPVDLIRHPGLLAIDIRRNMASGHIAPPASETSWHRWKTDSGEVELVLVDDCLPCVRTVQEPPLERLLTLEEAWKLRERMPWTSSPATRPLTEELWDRLSMMATSASSNDDTLRLARAFPSTSTIHGLMGRLRDDELVQWIRRQIHAQTPEGVLNEVFVEVMARRPTAPLIELLRRWKRDRFDDVWGNEVRAQTRRDQARMAAGRAGAGRQVAQDTSALKKIAESNLLDRIEQKLEGPQALLASRRAVRAFSDRHPIGSVRRLDDDALAQVLAPLKAMREGPLSILTVPILRADGKLPDALSSTVCSFGNEALVAELQLIRRLSAELHLDGFEVAGLLHARDLRGSDCIPLVSLLSLQARAAKVELLFDWAWQMHREARLDGAAMKHILMPDGTEADRIITSVPHGQIATTLNTYLQCLMASCEDHGALTEDDLRQASGQAPGDIPPLLQSLQRAGGARANEIFPRWQADVSKRLKLIAERRASWWDLSAPSAAHPAWTSRSALGHAGAIRELLSQALDRRAQGRMEAKQLHQHLALRDVAQTPGLSRALATGHLELTRILSDALRRAASQSLVTAHQLAELVRAVDRDGTPALLHAMASGTAETLLLYLRLISDAVAANQLPRSATFSLLQGRRTSDSSTAAFAAMQAGRGDTFQIWLGQVQTAHRRGDLTHQEWVQLLKAETGDGRPGAAWGKEAGSDDDSRRQLCAVLTAAAQAGELTEAETTEILGEPLPSDAA
ncbi:hypothetical protein [Roseateles amylovorans]|uniref:Uncharacterized protein n=1 Tax=Roseateles amylovorans TaxID=2978473 RepID=A0ABY6B3I9_9BURK|nr:hypothetical protein [Roseateles amylovorans]UXH79750.1 hypothetical protein N4261_07540 [Roseateles amylovorans]